ncbi:MAG: hypothetical protein ACPGF8_05780, partial [Opitutales bacterium]
KALRVSIRHILFYDLVDRGKNHVGATSTEILNIVGLLAAYQQHAHPEQHQKSPKPTPSRIQKHP